MGLKSIVKTLAVGAAAGAATVWFNDPERGRQRREEAKQKVTSAVGEARGVAEQTKDQVERAQEEVHQRADQDQQTGGRTDPTNRTTPTTPSDELIMPGQQPLP